MRRRALRGILMLAVVAVVAVACGSDEDEATSDASATTAAPPTKSPLVFGIVNTDFGKGFDLSKYADGFEAWADYVTKHGGIDGHPVEVVRCNDALEVEKAAACAREQIANENVLASTGFSILSAVVGPSFKEAGVPWVPLAATGANDFVDPAIALEPFTAGFYGAGSENIIKVTGKKKFASVRIDIPTTEFPRDAAKAGVAAAGGRFVAEIAHPAGAADFTPFALQLQESGAEIVALAMLSPDVIRLWDAARSIGFEPIWLMPATAFIPDVEAAAKRLKIQPYSTTDFKDPVKSTDPGFADYREAMKAADLRAANDTIYGYAAGKALEAAVKAVGPDEVTRSSLLEHLSTATLQDVPLFPSDISRSNSPGGRVPALGNTTTYLVQFQLDGSFKYLGNELDVSAVLKRM